MKSNIIKPNFELNDDKFTKIPGTVFNMLVDYKNNNETLEYTPTMVQFKDKDEYILYSNCFDIDSTKDVLVSKNGELLCYLRNNDIMPDNKEK